MKKAIAYISKKSIIELLKIPFGLELIGMEYPSIDDTVKITLEGDTLPVKELKDDAKNLPEVVFTIMHHWHLAKIEPSLVDRTPPLIEEPKNETKRKYVRKKDKGNKSISV